MARIQTVESALYRIPLTVTLSDSTHGEIAAFELVTCRVRDADGAEGTGYTYTVGRNGGATADILRRDLEALYRAILKRSHIGRACARDLVEEHEVRAHRERPHYGDPLLLAAGEPVGVLVLLVQEPETFQE